MARALVLDFEFDRLVNLAGQLRVVRGLGKHPLQQIQQLRFIRLLCFFIHNSKWGGEVPDYWADCNAYILLLWFLLHG